MITKSVNHAHGWGVNMATFGVTQHDKIYCGQQLEINKNKIIIPGAAMKSGSFSPQLPALSKLSNILMCCSVL